MASLRSRIGVPDPSKMIRIGGYFLVAGILVGVGLGVYALFNPRFFLVFINISEYEATSFFLGVYLPALVVIVGVGYVLATQPSQDALSVGRAAVLSGLVVLCLSLASLSIFNVVAVLGGVIALAAVVLAEVRPSFKVLWKKEACFFVQTGSVLIVSSSVLFLIMLTISRLLQTYSAGVYQFNLGYPLVLLGTVVLSVLTFAVTPRLGLRGSRVGLCGMLALALGVASSVSVVQNDYVYSNPAVYQGLFLLVVGVCMTLTGGFAYFRLSLSEELLPSTVNPSFVYRGRHCPHCGASWKYSSQHVCSVCGQSLYSEEATSFCSHCGRLIPTKVDNCPHCGADTTSLPVHILVETAQKKRIFSRLLDSVGLTLKEFVAIIVFFVLFIFLSYISYVRTELTNFGYMLVSHYGVPLEWLEVFAVGTDVQTKSGEMGRVYNFQGVGIQWAPLVLDLTIYFLVAFFVVYGAVQLRSRR